MKKIITLILTLSLIVLSLSSCFNSKSNDNDVVVRVGYLAGPTGIGMAKMIVDNKDDTTKYVFELCTQESAINKLAQGELDQICLPTNAAASQYNKAGESIKVLALNCVNSLFIISKNTAEKIDSIDDLEGKTIFAPKQGTPKIILEKLLEVASVNAIVVTEID